MYVITVNKKSSFHTTISIIYYKVRSYDVVISAIIHCIDNHTIQEELEKARNK